jgi:hypothetical protein
MSEGNTKPTSIEGQTPSDPYDPATMRLSQNFASEVGVKKVLTRIPCRKPNRQEFIRVRPGEDWRVDTAVFEDSMERETYLVATELIPELVEEVRLVCLRVAINKQGNPFLWPLKLPGPDGRGNRWHESAIDAANCAEKQWIRTSANISAGMYDIFQAAGDLKEPTWPEISFRDFLELAFRERRIDSYDHPILKSLRGDV